MKLNPELTIKRVDEIVTSSLDGEVVMMSIEKGKYYSLNPVSSHIWSLLEEEKSIDFILANLLEVYDIDTDTCMKETSKFIGDMIEENLIQIVNGQ
jgi:hypothetical protein